MSLLLESDGWQAAMWERQLPTPTPGMLAVEPLGALDGSATAALLRGLPEQADGWLGLASAIWVRRSGRWLLAGGREGPELNGDPASALSGELRISDTESLHLRLVEGRLHAWRYVEGKGDRVLIVDEEFRSTEGQDRLSYRVAWKRSPSHNAASSLVVETWRPWVARFAGWRP